MFFTIPPRFPSGLSLQGCLRLEILDSLRFHFMMALKMGEINAHFLCSKFTLEQDF